MKGKRSTLDHRKEGGWVKAAFTQVHSRTNPLLDPCSLHESAVCTIPTIQLSPIPRAKHGSEVLSLNSIKRPDLQCQDSSSTTLDTFPMVFLPECETNYQRKRFVALLLHSPQLNCLHSPSKNIWIFSHLCRNFSRSIQLHSLLVSPKMVFKF